ncbi:tRNA(Ile)-lysidine synthetase [Bifidobacterium goeldii]|uniref:tRNA(Ile)-lysidine synthase n=1 Tax=Bifidobacterium goeldii TaxID=2306975 RepID=A0A430FG87_9BIFI|nr:tRNA lysidine(34) synthetase TilS [Bifidobacterium goeldii]RSX51782.1 tRNA(Ile)-lysidine synthetase [Bifidobacterium goeldii]
MPYTARMRRAVGAVRATLENAGISAPPECLREHGEHEPDADAPLVLVACSGGRDSMALAAVAHIVCAALRVRCGAIIIDHTLQAGSQTVAQQAAQRCQQLDLDPVIVRRITVTDDGRGAEAAARDARYAAICETAREINAAAVLLAHTLDDQAETVLIGLLRSEGVDALAGMPETFERDGVRFLRPLIDLTRADTTGICEDLHLEWWDDPTNGDDKLSPALLNAPQELTAVYPLRSRIRHMLLPFLTDFAGGNIAAHLAHGSKLLRRDKDYLDAQADAALQRAWLDPADDILRLSASVLAHEHPAIRLRVLAHALAGAGINASARHIEAIDQLITHWHGQGAVNLPSGYSVNRRKHVIRLCQDGEHANRRRSGPDRS